MFAVSSIHPALASFGRHKCLMLWKLSLRQLLSCRMEECVHLVCELLGIQEDDEVGMEMILSLYTNIFFISTNLEDTKKAVSQVNELNDFCTRLWNCCRLTVMCSGQRWEWRIIMFSQKCSACSLGDGEATWDERRGLLHCTLYTFLYFRVRPSFVLH